MKVKIFYGDALRICINAISATFTDLCVMVIIALQANGSIAIVLIGDVLKTS